MSCRLIDTLLFIFLFLSQVTCGELLRHSIFVPLFPSRETDHWSGCSVLNYVRVGEGIITAFGHPDLVLPQSLNNTFMGLGEFWNRWKFDTVRRKMIDSCSEMIDVPVLFHQPWIVDNPYHAHANGILELYSMLYELGYRDNVSSAIIYQWPQVGEIGPMYLSLMNRIFPNRRNGLELQRGNQKVCMKQLIWGQGLQPFWCPVWPDYQWWCQAPRPIQFYQHLLDDFRGLVLSKFNIFPVPALNRSAIKRPTLLWPVRSQSPDRYLPESEIDAIIDIAASHGIDLKRYNQFHLPFEQQIEHIQQAHGIIGVHGAGLMNALYLPDNAILIELRTIQTIDYEIYRRLANIRRLGYVEVDFRPFIQVQKIPPTVLTMLGNLISNTWTKSADSLPFTSPTGGSPVEWLNFADNHPLFEIKTKKNQK